MKIWLGVWTLDVTCKVEGCNFDFVQYYDINIVGYYIYFVFKCVGSL